MTKRLAVVIPAYRPSAGLIDLVRRLTAKAPAAIVIVDDGSGPEHRDTFAAVAALPNVQLLRHAVNLGKGAALKTAFNHVLCAMPEAIGVVTADADGQHHPDDIEQVAKRLAERPDALVLGAREFDEAVPLRSRIGNVATRRVMQALLGQKITDTQTGLRGIPASLLPKLLRMEATGYEFELEMLLAAHHLAIPIVEQTIRTIYEPGNPSSHFNPLIDSMKIYFVLLRFGGVSLMSALLDNLVFILTVHRLGSVLGAQVLARVFSVVFNYLMVRSSVFYSHQAHRKVLPKYLALTLFSGTCSYLGIQALSTRFGMGVVTAKLLVETVLFFVNFAVQRAFIFKPNNGAPAERKPWTRPHPFALALGGVFLALVGLEVYGFRTVDLFGQDIWHPEGLRRFTRYAEFYAAFAAIVVIAAPRFFSVAIATLLAALTVMSVGPAAPAAVVLFLLSANALGSMALRKAETVEDQVCATLLGIGVYTFLMTFACRVPVNYPAVWGIALAIPIALDWRGLRSRGAGWLELLRTRSSAAFALLVFVLLAHWVVALKPEASADGLAMHLSIPANIAMEHRLTLEPARFIWAVMPMAADFAYAIVYQLGGEFASRLLVFAMLLAVCALLYRAARRWTSASTAHLLTAVFAATPIVQLVTGALFVENFVAAMILGTLTAIWRFGETGQRRYFFAAMAIGGTAMSAKTGALAFVIVALPFAFLEARRHWKSMGPRPAAACAVGVLLLLTCAAPPFAVAYVKTGNPLFPYLTNQWPSPLLPAGFDIRDARFKKPLSGWVLYDLTFHTDDFYEGQRGSAGFHWLGLVPLGIAGLAVVRRREAVSAAVVAAGASLVILSTEPNVRYLYAAMPLILVPAAATIGWMAERGRAIYLAVLLYTTACVGLNLWFLPSSSYYHKDFALRQPFSRAARDGYVSEFVSIRKVIEYFNQTHAKAPVLLTHEAANAGMDGVVYENHWHQPATFLKIREAADLPGMVGLMQGWNVRLFIGHKPTYDGLAEPPLLAEFLAKCTLPEYEVGDYYLAKLEPGCGAKRITEPAIVVRPGYYGDDDPAIVYQGDWKQDPPASGPDRNTRTRAETAGAQASLAFEGKALYYVFTRGPNHGIASVTIDGVARDPIDMYYPETDWQHKTGYCCFAPGRHVVVVRSTAEKNAASKGHTIDVDSFSVLQ